MTATYCTLISGRCQELNEAYRTATTEVEGCSAPLLCLLLRCCRLFVRTAAVTLGFSLCGFGCRWLNWCGSLCVWLVGWRCGFATWCGVTEGECAGWLSLLFGWWLNWLNWSSWLGWLRSRCWAGSDLVGRRGSLLDGGKEVLQIL